MVLYRCSCQWWSSADIVVPVDSDTGKLLVEKGESYSRDTIGETYMSGLFFQDPTDPDSSTRKTEFESLSDVLWRASELTGAQRLQYRKNAISVAEKKFGISVFEQEWDRVTTSLADYEMYERNKRGKVERLY
uniref:CAZy families GT4 protein n=1 Tax=uncultured Pichia TaxID=747082 RepID=A0A060BT69_9SACH|nr:CAZy families GT4 protein [uncultured Pichia]